MNKELKPNDMLLATLANPNAKVYDFLNNDVNPLNTQLLDKDYYKSKAVIKDQFTTADGKFDELAFNNFYNLALSNFNQIANEEAIKELDKVEYDPFNVMRPKDAKVYNVDVKFGTDYNPFKQLYSRSAINSITESPFSLREIAQQGQIYDIDTNTWSKSVNKLGLLDKVFGDTLVYAQWDEDGIHVDPINGRTVNHKKGDWKLDPEGKLFLEKLGNREVYGKQVVSISDILTTDGSALNKALDFFDSDGKEKSVGRVAIKTIAEIAPLLIPGFGTTYGGIRAAVGLASVMPTFFKAIDGLLNGDSLNYGNDPITKAEGWMSKFSQQSSSDKGSENMWNVEQISNMVSSIFTQIFEQRAMASLSTILMRPDKLLDARKKQLYTAAAAYSAQHGVNPARAKQMILQQSPSLKKAIAAQSQLSKALSLGYMALTSTGDIYGEAIESGYDRRTAGFAALLAASGQYGIMMNNPMGDWFLDETTGYHVNASKSMINKSIKPYLEQFQEIFKDSGLSTAMKRNKLAELALKVKGSMHNWFSVGGSNAILRNMITEGFEEVSEEVVLDATKGIVEVMGYLGLTKDKGTFRTIERYTSGEAFQEYLANFVGGLLGGGLFELERSHLGPWLQNKGKITPETNKSLVELVAAGYKEDLKKAVRRQAKYMGNNTLSYIQDEESESFKPTDTVSQSDLIAEQTIEIIEQLHILLNSEGLDLTDEQILQKAIRTELVMQGLEKTKEDGKHYGIEGLILDDFRNASVEIAKIKGVISDLESKEGTQESIKVEKEKLKPYKDTINSILSGEKTMKYFNQMTAYLDPDIRQIFGSLDKNNYVKAKYKIDYTNLPQDGVGLTKKSIDEEWDTFLESTNVKQKLEIITNAYLDLEKTLNPTIANYVDSGYDVLRKEVYQNIVDIRRTIGLFNTTFDPTAKQQLISQFININNKLERLGLSKVAPWTAYNIDVFNKLKDLGLIQKSITSIDSSGQEVITSRPYTQQELNTIEENGKTLEENLKEDFNSYSKIFPSNPFDIENIIINYNNDTKLHNQNNLQELNKLKQLNSSEPKIIQEIDKLEKSFKNIIILDHTNTAENIKLANNRNNNVKTYIDTNNISNSEYNNFLDILSNQELYNKSFDELLAEFGINSVDGLSDDQLLEFLNFLDSKGLINIARDYFRDKEAEEFFNQLSQGIVDKTNLDEILNYLKGTVNSNNTILNDTKLKDAHTYITNQDLLLEEEYAKSKPELFKMGNIAFDFLLDVLENKGLNDKELYNQLSDMAQIEFDSFIRYTFAGGENFTIDEALFFADDSNFDNFYDELVTKWEEYKEYIGSEDDSIVNFIEKSDLSDNLKDFFTAHYNEDMSIGVVMENLLFADENREKALKDFSAVKKFIDFNAKNIKLKSNPLYDFIRQFTLVLNSNPDSKLNKIFDILRNEELTFKAASGASNYLSEGIRDSDLQQAIDTLHMIKTVINKMSTTSYEGEGITGFIAMRQEYARASNLEDDVLNLKTIASDQANVMSNDIDILVTRLQFLKDLSITNSTKVANEDATIREKMNIIHTSFFEDILNIDDLREFIPDNMAEIINSQDSEDVKLYKLESSFYQHNKSKKKEAFSALLKNIRYFSANNRSTITREVTRGQITSYDKAMYFATILSLDTKDHLKLYLSTLEGKLDKAPFYMQEMASRITVATTQQPELFALTYDLKVNERDESDKLNVDLRYLTIVLGGAGTGKTTAITPLVMDILRQTNTSSNIWLAAPNQDRVDAFYSDLVGSIGEEKLALNKFSKKDLFSQFGNSVQQTYNQINSELKNVFNKNNSIITLDSEGHLKINLPENFGLDINFNTLPNLIVIDEITHFSTAEQTLLNEIAKISLNKGNFMKVVGLGDQTQMGFGVSVSDKEFLNYNVNGTNALFTPTLVTSIRATNDQKRLNLDTVLGLVNQSLSFFSDATKEKDADKYTRASEKFKQYLSKIDKEIGLKYYMSTNNLKGDYITNSLQDLTPLKAIKNAIDIAKDKDQRLTLGILSKNKVLHPEIETALSKVGLLGESYKDNIIIYTTDNVQGSEADYFIFDTDLIRTYDKNRDTLRAFYTYMSRSKIGTIIFDPEEKLKSEFYLTNTTKSQYAIDYEPIKKDLINSLKEDKIKKIKEFLNGDFKLSDDANFKWLVSTEAALLQGNVLFDALQVKPLNFNSAQESSDEWKEFLKTWITSDNFDIMLHSFYNNVNAKITDHEIYVDSERTNTDLNGLHNVDNKDQRDIILKNWATLKFRLLNNLDTNEILLSEFKPYFKHIFDDPDIDNITNKIKVEFLLTASHYDPNINNPFKKFGDDPNKRLSENDPFINLSAKLSYKGQTHYITLSSLSAQGTLEDAINTFWEPKGTKEEVKRKKNTFILAVKDTYSKIKEMVDQILPHEIIDLVTISKTDISQITSTRLENIKDNSDEKVKHFLHNLPDEFLGMNVSEIRWYPGNKNEFEALLERYTFGEKRSPQVIENLYNNLRNRPYIAVSFNNDLDGGINSSAKLIPIGSSYRKLHTVIAETMELKKEFHQQINTYYEEGLSDGKTAEELKDSFQFDPLIDAKFQLLLNKSQILDMLILWAQTPMGENGNLLDLFSTQYNLSSEDENNLVTIQDVMSGFRGTDGVTSQGFAKVLEIVKNEVKLYDRTYNDVKEALGNASDESLSLKDSILSKIEGISAWHRNFYNLFVFEDIVNTKEYQTQLEAIRGTVINEHSLIDSTHFETLKRAVRPLFKAIQDIDMDFYYSIPITVINGKLDINPSIAGKNGFSKDIMSDKFFINTTPEAPRFLISSAKFLSIGQDSNINVQKDTEKTPKSDTKKGNKPEEIITVLPASIFDLEFTLKAADGSEYKIQPLKPLKSMVDFLSIEHREIADKINAATSNIDLNLPFNNIIGKFFNNMGVGLDDSGNFVTSSFYEFLTSDKAVRRSVKQYVDELYNNLKQCK